MNGIPFGIMWRDRDPDVRGIPGMAMGALPVEGDPVRLVAELYRRGLRHVEIHHGVDLTATGKQRSGWNMALLRELTGWGVSVRWSLRRGDHDWRLFNHFFPPFALLGEPESAALRSWRETWYLCKCVYRVGPGFVEVRDRRGGSLSRFVIDQPDYLAALNALLRGEALAAIPEPALSDFRSEGLVSVFGETACWLPYRVRRWPDPAMLV